MTNPPTYTHRVLFRPLDFYFFGGELTFGNGGEVNYFAKTQPYPQQTTLLGVLRHLGFRAGLEIGKSFDHESTSTYGFIDGLSPLFMVRDDKEYTFGPFLTEAHTDASPEAEVAGARQWLDGRWQDQPVLPALNPKEHHPKKYLVGHNAQPEEWNEFAGTSQRIGIIKTTDARDKQDGFYKQEVGHLKRGASFACLVNLPGGLGEIPPVSVLGVGGEKARFAVTIEDLKEKKTFAARFPPSLHDAVASPRYDCAVLLSDAYVDRHLYEQLPFVVAETRDFRYLSSPDPTQPGVSWGRFQRQGEKNKGAVLRQSRKLNLLSRGSVLYAEDPKTLDNLLRDSRWQAIGYNHYYSFAKTSA